MRWRRFGSRNSSAALVFGWALLTLAGCGQDEPLAPEPGVSPFYPKPSEAAAKAEQSLGGGLNLSDGKPATDDPAAVGLRVSDSIDTRFGTNDVEKRVRIALRTAKKDPAAAAVQLDKILAIEPIHREALYGRATVALEQLRSAKSPEERAALVDKAVQTARALARAYDNGKPHEKELLARVLFRNTQLLAEKGQVDQAVAVVKEASELGFDAFGKIDADPSMASLRATPQFQAAQKADAIVKLAQARERTKRKARSAARCSF